MNKTQALAKLKPILGKSMGYRVDDTAPDAEERERRRVAYREAHIAAIAAREASKARHKALVEGDAEYQALSAAAAKAEKYKESLPAAHHYRITVGRNESFFFSVKAQGDTWDEVVSQLCKQPERV
jgi:hypothetical protein